MYARLHVDILYIYNCMFTDICLDIGLQIHCIVYMLMHARVTRGCINMCTYVHV